MEKKVLDAFYTFVRELRERDENSKISMVDYFERAIAEIIFRHPLPNKSDPQAQQQQQQQPSDPPQHQHQHQQQQQQQQQQSPQQPHQEVKESPRPPSSSMSTSTSTSNPTPSPPASISSPSSSGNTSEEVPPDLKKRISDAIAAKGKAKDIFTKFTQGLTKNITQPQLHEGISSLGIKLSESQCSWLFKQYSTNKNELSFSDFIKLLQ